MFIKIKLESKSHDRESNFISLSDYSTINDVKEQIAPIVDIPADEQIIKNVTKILENEQEICDICDLETTGCSTLILSNQDDEFVCFLVLYSDIEAERQRQLQDKSKEPSFYKNMPTSSTSSVTLIEDSEVEGSSSDSSSRTESSESSSDSEGDEDNEDNANKKNGKRKLSAKPNAKISPSKRRTLSYNSEMISKYLEELPNYTKGDVSSTTPTNKNMPVHTTASPSKTPNNDISHNPKATPNGQSDLDTTLAESNTSKPCALIAPEMRKFIAIVRTADCQKFLDSCSLHFERSDSIANLRFNQKMPIVLHTDGNLWITCDDDCTLAWILENLKSCAEVICNIEKLQDHFEYQSYTVVIPEFQSRSRSLSDQFRLLERQNNSDFEGLNTEKWIVQHRHMVENENDEFFDRKVSVLCRNEVLFLEIDVESEKYLKSKDFQLNYGFWKIFFEPKIL